MQLRTIALLAIGLQCSVAFGQAAVPLSDLGEPLHSASAMLPAAPSAVISVPLTAGASTGPVAETQTAAAPDAPDAPQVEALTLERALALAEKNSPMLQGASAMSARARAAIRTAGAYTNPEVEYFAGNQSARKVAIPGIPGLLQHYAASQTVEIPAERSARQRSARLASLSSNFGEAAIHLAVVAEVKHAFYDALARRAEVAYARDNLTLVEDLRRRVEVEVRVGEKGRLELTRAEAELARARFEVSSAQIRLANSIALLRVAIAAPADVQLEPQGELEPPIKLGPIDELRARVLNAHPAIAQSQTDIEQSKAQLAHERTLRIPQPNFYGEYEKQPDLTFWRIGVHLPLPLWNRRTGQIAEAKAIVNQSVAANDQRRLEIFSALERAYEQYQIADQQTNSLQSGSMHEAESAVDAAKAAYRFGERGIVEVLDAQRVLQSVRADLLNAQYARQYALIDLEVLGAVTPGGRP
ncbi:TolC family protein [Acidipila rosea]|uniref:TolC family protein n=1 Tax=Acidipila rosea TaxID=768535 RepID=UPI001FB30640|nr:TolC family protein [Acidipila rosea]